MAQVKNETVLLIGVLITITVFVAMGCKVKCAKTSEGYTRSEIGQDQGGRFHRSAVDYQNNPKSSPHYIANPKNKWQPLNMGPIDLESDMRKLSTGGIYDEFQQNWGGVSGGKMWINNDYKVRSDLTDLGDVQASDALDRQRSPGHVGNYGMTESQRRVAQKTNILTGPNQNLAREIVYDLKN